MSVSLGKLLGLISGAASKVSTQLASVAKQGTSINVQSMISLQMTMNKYTQIVDLASTTVSLFHQTAQQMIGNILR